MRYLGDCFSQIPNLKLLVRCSDFLGLDMPSLKLISNKITQASTMRLRGAKNMGDVVISFQSSLCRVQELQSRSNQWCMEYDPGRPRVTWLRVKPLCSSKEVAGMAWV